MNIEYHHWWSPSLNQEMALKAYGWYGKPVLVFPAQGGRFYEYEDFKMVEAIAWFIDAGKIKLYTVDSLDNQTSANWGAHPAERARRHEDFDRYITQEVMPLIRLLFERTYKPGAEYRSAMVFLTRLEEEGESTVRDVLRRIVVNEYKRRQAAPGLKVTSKAFGYGRRYPIAGGKEHY